MLGRGVDELYNTFVVDGQYAVTDGANHHIGLVGNLIQLISKIVISAVFFVFGAGTLMPEYVADDDWQLAAKHNTNKHLTRKITLYEQP